MKNKRRFGRFHRLLAAAGLCALACLGAGLVITRPVGCSNDDLTAPLEVMTEDSSEEEKVCLLYTSAPTRDESFSHPWYHPNCVFAHTTFPR